MKVWSDTFEHYSPSLQLVVEKFKEYAPSSMEFVEDWIDADLCVDHLIGSPHREELVNPLEDSFSSEVIARLELPFSRNAYMFYCNIIPDEFYRKAVEEAVIYGSYLDIPMLTEMPWDHRFYRTPLGVTTADFLLPMNYRKKEYLCYAWGASADPEDEYIRSLYEACKKAGGKLLHSGKNYEFDNGEHYVFVPPAKDKSEVAERYAKSWFANAMREEDGFELANIEAPLSNCWPITLEKECYRRWFHQHAIHYSSIFVESGDHLVNQLFNVFDNKEEYVVSPYYKRHIIETFDWKMVCGGFWDKIIKSQEEGVF